jgi:hypothetical protein
MALAPIIITVDFWSIRDGLSFLMKVNRNRASGGGGTTAEMMPWIKGDK